MAPVTNAEYARFVAATDHEPPKHWKGKTPPEDTADHPVTHVTWHDAVSYGEWAEKRLPSELEWEKAARGTDGREYPWGDWNTGRCNTKETGIKSTTPVGQHSPFGDSPYGCVDMAGNVWEWTSTEDGSGRVVRGGSWGLGRFGARCTFRLRDPPFGSGGDFGCRVVLIC
jgi:formylglycine-generating enzyme required for sulfatase activity